MDSGLPGAAACGVFQKYRSVVRSPYQGTRYFLLQMLRGTGDVLCYPLPVPGTLYFPTPSSRDFCSKISIGALFPNGTVVYFPGEVASPLYAYLGRTLRTWMESGQPGTRSGWR